MKPEASGSPDPAVGDNTPPLRALISFNAQVLGITMGILCALGIFVATDILVFKGGPNVGAHLRLLGEYFYGYKVTFLGSIIGSLYGFLVGYAAGALIAVIYNSVAYLRSR